VNGKQIKP